MIKIYHIKEYLFNMIKISKKPQQHKKTRVNLMAKLKTFSLDIRNKAKMFAFTIFLQYARSSSQQSKIRKETNL